MGIKITRESFPLAALMKRGRRQNYVTIGTALFLDDEENPDIKNKYLPEWKQTVTDEKGRKRLHGAFTGGFSAGYFNTVGSKEGWAPQNDRKAQSVQDFMDEEDLQEHQALVSVKTDYTRQAPEALFLPDFILPKKDSIGKKLYEAMGGRADVPNHPIHVKEDSYCIGYNGSAPKPKQSFSKEKHLVYNNPDFDHESYDVLIEDENRIFEKIVDLKFILGSVQESRETWPLPVIPKDWIPKHVFSETTIPNIKVNTIQQRKVLIGDSDHTRVSDLMATRFVFAQDPKLDQPKENAVIPKKINQRIEMDWKPDPMLCKRMGIFPDSFRQEEKSRPQVFDDKVIGYDPGVSEKTVEQQDDFEEKEEDVPILTVIPRPAIEIFKSIFESSDDLNVTERKKIDSIPVKVESIAPKVINKDFEIHSQPRIQDDDDFAFLNELKGKKVTSHPDPLSNDWKPTFTPKTAKSIPPKQTIIESPTVKKEKSKSTKSVSDLEKELAELKKRLGK